MKKINKYVLGFVAVALLSQSCKKTMIDLNTNPNLLSDAAPEYLFTGATQDLNMGSRDRTSQKYGTTMTWMQYVVPEGVSTDALSNRYWKSTMSPTQGPVPNFPYYNDYFNAIGRDMNRIIEKIDNMPAAEKETYKGLRAICQVVDVFHAWRVADIFGALPYSQAFQPEKYPLPAYDYNWDLYKVFESKLKEAATALAASGTSQISLGNQDMFYDGDYAKWLGFANSLRIKIAQRYEERDPAQLTAVLTDIASNFSNKIMASNDGSFAINHTRDWNNNVDDINVLLFSYNASFSFVEHLKATADPRIKFMIRENDLGTNSKQYRRVQDLGTPESQTRLALPENQVRYWGKHASPASAGNTAYGSTGGDRYKTFTLTGTNGNQTLGFQSAIQSRLFIKNGGFGGFHALSSRDLMHDDESFVDGSTIKMKTYFISYPDVCFMMAEIAAKGGNGLGKTAEEWYRTGVAASFDLYKQMAVATKVPGAESVSAGTFATTIPYLGLPSIYTQSWVNNLLTPDEAWATWKRTGYPEFTDVRAGDNGLIGTSSIAYLENLWDGSENLKMARRDALKMTSSLNQKNFVDAVEVQKAKDASYGASATDTKGRIWWDKP